MSILSHIVTLFNLRLSHVVLLVVRKMLVHLMNDFLILLPFASLFGVRILHLEDILAYKLC